MYIPGFLIVLPCIAAFVLSALMYYRTDPEKRLTDVRMLTMWAAILVILLYSAARVLVPGHDWVTVPFFLLGLATLAAAVQLTRRGVPKRG